MNIIRHVAGTESYLENILQVRGGSSCLLESKKRKNCFLFHFYYLPLSRTERNFLMEIFSTWWPNGGAQSASL